MNSLLLSKNTKRQMGLILKSPPHALLICGQPGSGKRALAEQISSALLNTSPDKLSRQPYFNLIEKPEGKQEIPIEAVREIIKQLRLKPVIAAGQVKRVVLIDGAHLMSAEAQNALLKAIEEPPAATAFLLTAISENSVLPTIASRSQKLKIGTASMDEALAYFKNEYEMKAVESAWRLSGGAAGLMAALLNQDDRHSLKLAVENAKKILGSTRYERALLLDSLSSNKADFPLVLDALGRVLAALHRNAIGSHNAKASQKLITARRQVDTAINSLQKNTSVKLVALDLALNLTV